MRTDNRFKEFSLSLGEPMRFKKGSDTFQEKLRQYARSISENKKNLSTNVHLLITSTKIKMRTIEWRAFRWNILENKKSIYSSRHKANLCLQHKEILKKANDFMR